MCDKSFDIASSMYCLGSDAISSSVLINHNIKTLIYIVVFLV
jgi:hypothetical protein